MKKNNIPLVLGMFIPLLMIIFVAVSIYVPALLTQPKYNFIYATGGNYYQLESYAVKNAKLVKNEIKYPPNYNTAYTPIPQKESKLYIHDVEKDISREISFEEAQKFNLSPVSISPDGFEVISGSHDYSIFSLFFSRGDFYGAKYIRGHGISKRLNLEKGGQYQYYNIHFIGWIIP